MYLLLFLKISKVNLLVLLVAFFALCTESFSQTVQQRLDSFFSTINKNGSINGTVLIAEKGNILYKKSFGYADIQNKIPNTASTLFQIASVSKIFTTIAVLQLQEQKKLSLTDKFITYFPEFPYPEITIKQMLSNTSGIPDIGDVLLPFWRLNRDTVFTLQDVIPALKKRGLPLDFEPGNAWEYANINFTLSALLVEKISGQKFGSYLSKNIFKQAGMKNTFLKASGENAYTHVNVAYNYAWPYMYSLQPVRVDSFAINDYLVHYKTWPSEGDANIYTSVLDLTSFYKALAKGLILKKKSLESVFTPTTKNNGKKVILRGVGSQAGELGDFYWGLGNRISLDSTIGKIVWESGGMPGCSADIITNLTKDQLIIWLDNKQSDAAMNNIFEALNILNNRSSVIKKSKLHIANVYGKTLFQFGEDAAFIKLIEMKSDTMNYILDEDEFNLLGYEFLENNLNAFALTSFRTALFLFPNSDNIYNSYGEALAKSGKKEDAILMYRRSLLLNPKNEDSERALRILEHNK